MNNLEQVITEDMNAAVEAFKDDSFDNVNVFANRIMSNIVIGNDSKFCLIGFFLKDLAFTFGVIKTRKRSQAFSTAKSHGFTYIETLRKSIKKIDEKQLWMDFHMYSDRIRKFEMTKWEEKCYSDNKEFTNKSYRWLLGYLQSNQSMLSDPRNFLIKNIVSEMVRLFRVHSANMKDIIILCLLIALNRNYEYVCKVWNRPDARIINEKQIRELILPFVERIFNLSTKDFEIKEADKVLWELIKCWRILYIQYGELMPPGVALQRGIEIPEELKKKLTESFTKTLENEM